MFRNIYSKGLVHPVLPMLFIIWLVPCQRVLDSNPPRSGALIYANEFTRDVIHECGEASLGFPHEVFLGNIEYI
jgi:hypothetical protein